MQRLREALHRFRSMLEPRDQEILRERILSESPDTLEQIGSRYRISRERARQLEERLRVKLSAYLDREILGTAGRSSLVDPAPANDDQGVDPGIGDHDTVHRSRKASARGERGPSQALGMANLDEACACC